MRKIAFYTLPAVRTYVYFASIAGVGGAALPAERQWLLPCSPRTTRARFVVWLLFVAYVLFGKLFINRILCVFLRV